MPDADAVQARVTVVSCDRGADVVAAPVDPDRITATSARRRRYGQAIARYASSTQMVAAVVTWLVAAVRP